MAHFLRLILLGLIGAAIVHICVLLLVPVYSEMNAWLRIEYITEPYRFHPLDKNTGVIGNPDPLVEEALCRFDLADGPVRIMANGDMPYWSLSVYAPNGDNLYNFNDNVSNEHRLDLILADPLGMASLRVAGTQADGQSLLVTQNIGEGAVVLRVFVQDATWKEQARAFFDEAQCQTFEPE
ncbi:hypothetical protein AAIB41_01690 [Brucella sp. BE17]|uniref:DUF1254 domain-containing protein n=1 Tax=Brucella sp. BE17 TaxID=3142977 RepID=UPI0031BB517B